MEIGGYRTERLIGIGAHARVWAARTPDGALVALKVLDAPVSRALPAARREVACAATVDHRHLLGPRAVVTDGAQVALVSSLATGGSLAALVDDQGPLSVEQTLTVLLPLAGALATAHERGVVHGDLSPANVVLDDVGRPLLTDLGSARILAEHGLPVAATPGWVAPEVARGGEPGPASDVFSLGAIGLYCLTGRPAWQADDLRDVVVQATVGQWPDPGELPGAARFVAALRSALLDRPERRPGAAALRIELGRCGAAAPLPEPGADPWDLTGVAADRRDPGGVPGRPDPGGVTRRVLTQVRPRDRQLGETIDDPDPGDDDRRPAWLRLRVLRRGRGGSGADDHRPPPEPLGRGRHARAPGRPEGGPGRRRAVLIAVVGALVVVLAVRAGLWWADSSATLPQASAAGGGPSATAAPPAPPVPTSVLTTPPTVLPTTALPTTALPTTVPPLVPPVASVPASVPASAPAPAAPSPTEPRPRGVDWAATVRALDDRRAAALVRRDPSLLDRVYLPGVRPAAQDRRTIDQLLSRGLRVTGARHEILAAAPCPRCAGELAGAPGAVVLVVTDRLPAYPVRSDDGVSRGSTAARSAATSVVVLVPTPAGYRIGAVDRA